MKLQILNQDLLEGLNRIKAVVPSKATLPILEHVLLTVDGDAVMLAATNLQASMVVRTVGDSADAGSVCIPYAKLHGIIKATDKQAVVTISTTETKATIKAGRGRFTVGVLPAAEYPEMTGVADAVLSVPVDGAVMLDTLGKVAHAAGRDDVRHYLNGVLLEIGEHGARMVATDGHRLSKADAGLSSAITADWSGIVPITALAALKIALSGSDAVLHCGHGWIAVESDGMLLRLSLVDGRYPDYKRVINEASMKAGVSIDALVGALGRVATMANEKYRGVKLALSSGKLDISATNQTQDEAQETIDASYDGNDFVAGFCVDYLLDVLRTLEGDTVTLGFNDNQFVVSTDEALHIVMQMRL